METDATKPPLPPPPIAAAQASSHQGTPDASASPWESYLAGKKEPANRLLAKMEAARVKGGLLLPDESTRRRFADTLVAKPDGVARFVVLLQACRSSSDTVRRVVLEFAEAGIKRLGVVAFPEALDPEGYCGAIEAWLVGLHKKPIKPAELNLLFLFLLYGWYRNLLCPDTAFNLAGLALADPATAHPQKALSTKPAPSTLEVLLSSTPTLTVLEPLLEHSKATRNEASELRDQIKAQATEIARLTDEWGNLSAKITQLQEEVTSLKDEKIALKGKAQEMERRIVDLRDGYQHKLDQLRGRIRGMLQGQITRWLQTALDASRSDPPWTQAIQERLEDTLRLIDKETQWLQPSE